MNRGKKIVEIRFRVSEADRDRLRELSRRLELNISEVIRYYIRDAYAALGARVEGVPQAQLRLFPVTLPDGLTAIPTPVPRRPEAQEPPE